MEDKAFLQLAKVVTDSLTGLVTDYAGIDLDNVEVTFQHGSQYNLNDLLKVLYDEIQERRNALEFIAEPEQIVKS